MVRIQSNKEKLEHEVFTGRKTTQWGNRRIGEREEYNRDGGGGGGLLVEGFFFIFYILFKFYSKG